MGNEHRTHAPQRSGTPDHSELGGDAGHDGNTGRVEDGLDGRVVMRPHAAPGRTGGGPRERFVRLVGPRLWFLVMLPVGFWLAPHVFALTGLGPADAPGTRDTVEHVSKPDAEAERLIAVHDCWHLDERALAAIPGHAVVRFRDSGEVRYVGTRWTGAALGQVFDGVDHGLVVYVFCR